jgi:chromodomain-helicase-DNA-binding protein 4
MNLTSYHDISETELSDDDLTRSDPVFDTRRSKRQRTLAILSGKAGSKTHRVSRKETRSSKSKKLVSLGKGYREDESDISFSDSSEQRIGTRRSSRMQKSRSSLRYEMQSDFSADYESEEQPSGRTSRSSLKPRVPKSTEYFPIPDEESDFAKRHQYWCQFSNDYTAIEDEKQKYAMCQGCSFMYHVECLNTKADRLRTGQNVITLDERDNMKTCVLQCGRCNGGGKNGMITMRCLACGEVGDRCGDFKHPERAEPMDEVEGDDDVDAISERKAKVLQGWNDASKVMFRCMQCHRACHFDHLPPPIDQDDQQSQNLQDGEVTEEPVTNGETVEMQNDNLDDASRDPDQMAVDTSNLSNDIQVESSDVRSKEPTVSKSDILETYTGSDYWRCNECRQYVDKKVEVVLGWRSFKPVSIAEDAPEDFYYEYLIKFEEESYARATWVPATWLSGISYVMKNNFDAKRTAEIHSSEDIIPEAWLRADIIFDAVYEGDRSRDAMRFKSEIGERNALSKVTQALCKWQKLKYEESMALNLCC